MKVEFFASYEYKPDWKSAGIMLATGCDFSHVGLIVNNEKIYHAVGEGFLVEDLGEFMRIHGFAHRFELTLADDSPHGWGRALGWLEGNLGKDYSETQFFGFSVELVARFLPAPVVRRLTFFGQWIKGLVSDGTRELVCSEAVIRFAIEHCGLKTLENPDFVTPEESVAIMEQVKK